MTEEQYRFEERAAILEYEAGMPRPIAEAEARAQVNQKARSQLDMFGEFQ